MFNQLQIWFADEPFDVEKYDHVTFFNCKKDVELDGFSKKEFFTMIIDLNQDLDAIWGKFNKKSARYSINKAIKDGVEVIKNQYYPEFIEMNRSFRIDKKLPPLEMNEDYFRQYGTLYVAKYNDELISGQFFFDDDKNRRWYIGASKRLSVEKTLSTVIGNANRLILWEAIKDAKASNKYIFDFGGYAKDTTNPELININSFKASFGGDLTIYYIYEKTYSKIQKLFTKLSLQ